MKISLGNLEKILLSEINLSFESDTPEYILELDNLITSMKSLKNSLRKGPSRIKHRKEMHRLQGAIEAVRFLKRSSEKSIERKKLLSEGGAKVPADQKAPLTPEVVTQAISLYRDLMGEFNEFLGNRGLRPVKLIRPVGSTYYYQEDLEEGSDVVYGDIDYLVSLPPADGGENFSQSRKAQAALKRNYEKEFLEFIQTSPPDYVDVDLTGDKSPTMVIVEIGDGKKIQIDLISTSPKYEEWMQTRWVPERGVKGYIGGNLYKSLGDALTLTISSEGVLARIKDDMRVTSKDRSQDVTFIQVSSNPSSFFKDIVDYLSSPGDFSISTELENSPGIDPTRVTISGIANGIRLVAENLELNNTLPEKFESATELLEEVLARFKLNIDAAIRKKSQQRSSGEFISEEDISKLVKMNSEQYNNVRNVFKL